MILKDPAYSLGSADYTIIEDEAPFDLESMRPFSYVDTDDTHKTAAYQLIELAKRHMAPAQEGDTPEMIAALNPGFALPAAYIKAREIYDLTYALDSATSKPADTSTPLRAANRHLNKLLNGFSLRRGNAEDLIGAVDQEGEENLGYAVNARAEEISRALENNDDIFTLKKDEPAALCEALGQLCVEEVARIHAASPQGQSKRLLTQEPVAIQRASNWADDGTINPQTRRITSRIER